jgi:hypothetical protein
MTQRKIKPHQTKQTMMRVILEIFQENCYKAYINHLDMD